VKISRPEVEIVRASKAQRIDAKALAHSFQTSVSDRQTFGG